MRKAAIIIGIILSLFIFTLLFAALPEILAIRQGHLYLNWKQPFQAISGYFERIREGTVFEYRIGPSTRYFLKDFPSFMSTSLCYVFLSGALGTTLGIILGMKFSDRERKVYHELLGILGSVPDFIIIILLQLAVISIYLATGLRIARVATGGSHSALLLPLIAMSLFPMVYVMRLVSNQAHVIRGEQYILNAHARGIHKRSIFFRHILPGVFRGVKSELPRVFGLIMANLFIAERLFNMPGITRIIFSYGFRTPQSWRLSDYQYHLVVNSLLALIIVFFAAYFLTLLLITIAERLFGHE
ncbi:MAG: ABC transporter permease subunit [Spirochaetales bacterium]|nr:ABC transporter permease subunit [Spirochaetales bacterium]